MSRAKGGRLSKKAAMLCNDANFCIYLDRRVSHKRNMTILDGTHTPEDAKYWMLNALQIQSRAEIDHNSNAAKLLNVVILSFTKWREKYKSKTQLRSPYTNSLYASVPLSQNFSAKSQN